MGGNFEGKSEIPDFSIFQFWAFPDLGTLKIEFLGKNQYRAPRPRLTTPHLVELSAENVKISCSNAHFGLPLLTIFWDPGNFSNFQFWVFLDPGTLKIEFLGKNQYRTPRPRLPTLHQIEFWA